MLIVDANDNTALPRIPSMRSRHSLRINGYDYTQVGAYFITVVTRNRTCVFGDVLNGESVLNVSGRIVQTVWNELPVHFRPIGLDEFVVMPNHVHGIIMINDAQRASVGAQHAAPLHQPYVKPGSLGAIVRSFKSAVSKRVNETHEGRPLRLWQRNYYEHIIRNEESLLHIREYIASNPSRWSMDPENPTATRIEPKNIWRIGDDVRAQHAAPVAGARRR